VTSPLHDQPLLPHLVIRSLDAHDDAPCMHLAGRVATYAEIRRRTSQLLQAQRARDVTRGSRLAVLSKNRPEVLTNLTASLVNGCVLTPLHPMGSLADHGYAIGDAEIDCLVFDAANFTERARDLMPVLGALATWGYDWAWGPPREGEAIDVGAILRVAPGLLAGDRSPAGSVECVVSDAERSHYALTAAGGRVSIEERPAGEPDARVTGSERDWVTAFSPGGGLEHLEVSGSRPLAQELLGALGLGSASRESAAA